MALITQAPLNGCFLLSEAEGERSRAKGNLGGTAPLPPGTLVSGAWGTDVPLTHLSVVTAGQEATVTGILFYWADPAGGVVEAPFIVRDAEVNEALLIYGPLDREKVADALALNGVVVRRSVLSAPAATFGTNPATDTALTNSVYGPKGLTALAPGGAYGNMVSVEVAGVEVLPDATGPEPPDAPSQGPQSTDRPRPAQPSP